MTILPKYIDITNHIDNRGYTIIPHKEDNGKYRVLVWLNDDFIKKGSIEYNTWQQAQRDTYINFYKHLNKL